MFSLLRRYRFVLTLFLFLMIPIISIGTAHRAPREYAWHDRLIVAITWPIQSGISWVLEHIHVGFHHYLFLWNSQQESRIVFRENRRLHQTIANLRETEQENLRLKRLLQLQETHALQTVVARVIARDVSTEFRSIRVDKGESSGIRKDMAVVTEEGIVGRVLRVSANTADVVTLLDLLSAVDAIVQRSRAQGIVEGFTDENCQLKFALRTDDIQEGDVLISSGLGGIFPKGLRVGLVSRVNRKPYGITQEVEVRPSVDFTKLEEVALVLNKELQIGHLPKKD